MTELQHHPSLSERSTDSKSSSEENIISFQSKNLRKIAPNIFEIINQNRVLKISKHMCLDFGGFDSSEDENYDQDNYDHIQKCQYLEREFKITRRIGEQNNLIHYYKLHKNIIVAGVPCCALEMPLYQTDFFDRFISEEKQGINSKITANCQKQQKQKNSINEQNESSSEEENCTDDIKKQQRLQKQYNKDFFDIKNKMKAVLEQIYRLHQNNLCHNDIKPENILYCTSGEGRPILIDLEYATYQDKTNFEKQKDNWEFRDLNYCAPEVFKFLSDLEQQYSDEDNEEEQPNQEIGSQEQLTFEEKLEQQQQKQQENNKNKMFDEFKNDIYMYTVTFFVLLFKKFPTKHENLRNIQKKQLYSALNLQKQIIKLVNYQAQDLNVQPISITEELVDFFAKGMVFDSKKRFSAKELLNHPFLQKDYQITNFDLSELNTTNNNNDQNPKKSHKYHLNDDTTTSLNNINNQSPSTTTTSQKSHNFLQ